LNGANNLIIVERYVPIITQEIQFGATSIVDGQPSFARANINSFTSANNYSDNDSGFMQFKIPSNYVNATSIGLKISHYPSNTSDGSFGWTLNYQFQQPGDTLLAAAFPNVTATQASVSVINRLQNLSFTIPQVATLAADTVLIMELINTSSPAATNPLIINYTISYQKYLYQ
jgi:hypothetical protein